jgi:tetratricopeptide (TPR) repeat protein
MDLAHQITELEESGLIRLLHAEPELEYLFRHVMIQDAAYATLLNKERRKLHRATAEVLEMLYPERVEELAPVLGYHFLEAVDYKRALKYFTLAGDLAMGQYANVEAAAHYGRALEVALHSTITSEQLIDLYTRRGRVLELETELKQALENYAAMQHTAQERGDRSLEMAALIEQGKLYATPTAVQNAEKAQAASEQALVIAHELKDRAAESKVVWNLMLIGLYATSEPDQAIHYGEQSLMLARELGLREQLAFTTQDIFMAYWHLGQFEKAIDCLSEANILWRELNNLPMLVENLSHSATIRILAGDYDTASSFSDEAQRIASQIGNTWSQVNARVMNLHIFEEQGDIDKAIEVAKEASRFGIFVNHPSVTMVWADLAMVYAGLGALSKAIELVTMAVDFAQMHPILLAWPNAVLTRLLIQSDALDKAEVSLQQSLKYFSPGNYMSTMSHVTLARAELAMAQGHYANVIASIDKYIAGHVETTRIRLFAPDALHLKAKALTKLGNEPAAYDTLHRALAASEQVHSRRSKWPILLMLSELERQRGNLSEADFLCQQAQEIIHYIAAHISSSELRSSFFGLPQVRAALTP